MVWLWAGNKPLSKPMMDKFTDVYASPCHDELNHFIELKLMYIYSMLYFMMWFILYTCVHVYLCLYLIIKPMLVSPKKILWWSIDIHVYVKQMISLLDFHVLLKFSSPLPDGLAWAVWYKTKFGSQNLATKFGNHLCMVTKIGSQC